MKLLQFDYTSDRYKIGTAQISSKCCVWSKNPQFWLYYTWYKRWFKFIFHILNILKFLRRLIRLLRIYTGSRKWHLIWPKCQLKISLQFYGLVPFIPFIVHNSFKTVMCGRGQIEYLVNEWLSCKLFSIFWNYLICLITNFQHLTVLIDTDKRHIWHNITWKGECTESTNIFTDSQFHGHASYH